MHRDTTTHDSYTHECIRISKFLTHSSTAFQLGSSRLLRYLEIFPGSWSPLLAWQLATTSTYACPRPLYLPVLPLFRRHERRILLPQSPNQLIEKPGVTIQAELLPPVPLPLQPATSTCRYR